MADYGLGVLSPTESRAVRSRVCARAASRSWWTAATAPARVRGATVATPNEVEAMEALGLEHEAELTDGKRLSRRVAETGIEISS